jgi:hypothetical protein
MVFDSRFRAITLAMLAALVSSTCGPRLAPRIQVPAAQTDQTAYRDAYTAFWWNCAIVKSIDLNARCPNACTGAQGETKYGPERTREILSFRVGEDDGHARIRSHFPYGPQREISQD